MKNKKKKENILSEEDSLTISDENVSSDFVDIEKTKKKEKKKKEKKKKDKTSDNVKTESNLEDESNNLDKDEITRTSDNDEVDSKKERNRKKRKNKNDEIFIEESEHELNKKLFISFIGKNNEMILNYSLSLCAFLFSGLYFVYRKMYLIGYPLILLESFLILYLNNAVGYIIVLVISVISCLFFKKMYFDYVFKKVQYIKSNYDNEDNIEELCKNCGGTSFGKVVLSFILIEILVILLVLIAPIISGNNL